MSRILLLATTNQGKVLELKQALAGISNWQVMSLADFPNLPEIEETGTTFEENAILKASSICKLTGHFCLSDDSGLEVNTLDNQPGVFSARFAGEGATDEQNNLKLLIDLRGTPSERRHARFRCVLALARPDGKDTEMIKITEGSCEGVIAEKMSGDHGFGYDPLFIPIGFTQTFGELGQDVKKKLSHRSKALIPMVEFIQTL